MKLLLWVITLMMVGCSTGYKKINPDKAYETATGFKFKVPMAGTWMKANSKANFFLFAREPNDPEVTVLAEVRHGPIVFGQDPPRNTKEMLDVFERDLVAGTVSARLKNIKNQFKRVDYKSAACLSFNQVGEDHAAANGKGQVTVLTFDGISCIHPQKPERYIRMVLSQRAPAKKIEDLSKDLKKFTDSLEFL